VAALIEVFPEEALRRSVWKLAAAALGVAAIVFVAGAIALGASQIMPAYAALLLSGTFLAGVSLACIVFGERTVRPTAKDPSPAIGSALELLSKKAAESPGKSMLAGLAAGAAYGLLDSLDHRKK
jgi:hypothetical protein